MPGFAQGEEMTNAKDAECRIQLAHDTALRLFQEINALKVENVALKAQLEGRWQPMAIAPLDREILLLCDSAVTGKASLRIGRYNSDKFAKKPRPYWVSYGNRTTHDRGHPPRAWMPLPEGE